MIVLRNYLQLRRNLLLAIWWRQLDCPIVIELSNFGSFRFFGHFEDNYLNQEICSSKVHEGLRDENANFGKSDFRCFLISDYFCLCEQVKTTSNEFIQRFGKFSLFITVWREHQRTKLLLPKLLIRLKWNGKSLSSVNQCVRNISLDSFMELNLIMYQSIMRRKQQTSLQIAHINSVISIRQARLFP